MVSNSNSSINNSISIHNRNSNSKIDTSGSIHDSNSDSSIYSTDSNLGVAPPRASAPPRGPGRIV